LSGPPLGVTPLRIRRSIIPKICLKASQLQEHFTNVLPEQRIFILFQGLKKCELYAYISYIVII
jgi:hypothetical protein